MKAIAKQVINKAKIASTITVDKKLDELKDSTFTSGKDEEAKKLKFKLSF